MSDWQHDALIVSLMKLIEARPDDMDCRDNARRVMAKMGLPVRETKPAKAKKAVKP